MRLEQTILRNLIHNEDYLRKVIPFLKPEYFSDSVERTIFNEITSFTETYNNPPTTEAVGLAVKEKRNLTSDEVQRSGKAPPRGSLRYSPAGSVASAFSASGFGISTML